MLLLLPAPDPKILPPAEAFAAFLSPRPRRSFVVEFSDVGRVELFVPALSSRRWVEIHRKFGTTAKTDAARAEAEYLAAVVEDKNGARALSPDDVLGLYDHEAALLLSEASRALALISPTDAAADHRRWGDYLREGAAAPENLADAFSLGGCYDVSWGYGKGAVHVRDNLEHFFGIPRRDLLDCHWMVYRAARRLRADMMRA